MYVDLLQGCASGHQKLMPLTVVMTGGMQSSELALAAENEFNSSQRRWNCEWVCPNTRGVIAQWSELISGQYSYA